MIIDPVTQGIILDPDIDLSNCHVYWYRSFKPEYYFVYELGSSTQKMLLHRWVYEQKVGTIPPGYSIHHVNHNQLDNRIVNLQLMKTGDHHRLHSKGRIASPQEKANMSVAIRKNYLEHPEIKKKIGEATRKRFEDPEERKKISLTMKQALDNPASRKRLSESSKRNWADPQYRKNYIEARKKTARRKQMNKEMIDKIDAEVKVLTERLQTLSYLRDKLIADPRALERDRATIGITITSECSFESFPEV